MRSIACPSTSTCRVIGDGGTVLTTTIGGSTWTVQAIASTTATTWIPDTAFGITQPLQPSSLLTTTLGYDPASEVTSLRTVAGTTTTKNLTLSYNADGDRTAQSDSVSGAGSSYGYDQADRPITATSGLTQSSYTYDGDGLRQSKTVSGTTTQQTWDTAEGLPLLLQDGSTRYVAGPDGSPIEQIASDGTVLYYYQDQLGSTRGLLNGAGQTVATSTYDPYGKQTASTGSVSTPFGFAGQYTDAETGVQYLQARSYDPATMQFASVDPLVDQTGQPYAYAADDPLNMLDPTGLGACHGAQGQGWARLASAFGDLGCNLGEAKDAVLNNVGSATASLGDPGPPSCDRTPDGCLDAPTPEDDQGRLALLAQQQQTIDESTRQGYVNLGNTLQGLTDMFITQPLCIAGDPYAPAWQRILAAASLIPGGEDLGIGRVAIADKITGYTIHGLNQAIGRNGGKGVAAKAIIDAVTSPRKVIEQANGTTKYVGKDATVVLNSDGKVVTTFGKARGPRLRPEGTTRPQGSGSAQRRANQLGLSYNPRAIR